MWMHGSLWIEMSILTCQLKYADIEINYNRTRILCKLLSILDSVPTDSKEIKESNSNLN
jgi:hypothetical protein